MGYVMRRDAGTAEANEPPFLMRAVGEIKYAVVLSREYEDHVVGWGSTRRAPSGLLRLSTRHRGIWRRLISRLSQQVPTSPLVSRSCFGAPK
jgi:hypothetical protein